MTTADRSTSPEQPLTKGGYAYRTLPTRILEGELPAGARLLLRQIAEELGLSVMPVCDAMRQLERTAWCASRATEAPP